MSEAIIELTDDAGDWQALLIPATLAEDGAEAVAAYRRYLEDTYGITGVTNAGARGPYLYALRDGEWQRAIYAGHDPSGRYWRVESGFVE